MPVFLSHPYLLALRLYTGGSQRILNQNSVATE